MNFRKLLRRVVISTAVASLIAVGASGVTLQDNPNPDTAPSPSTLGSTLVGTAAASPEMASLEARANALIQGLRLGNQTITDYSTIGPIVDAVFQESGLRRYSLQVIILPPERFNRKYCDDISMCIEKLSNNPTSLLAFTKPGFVYVREGQFDQVLTSAFREIFMAISGVNHGAAGAQSLEIAGNLGLSFAYHTLAEKFDYDPRSVADTPEARAMISAGIAGMDPVRFEPIRAAWSVNEALGSLDRTKPANPLTAAEALAAYKDFVGRFEPDRYAGILLRRNTPQGDAAWITAAVTARLGPSTKPTPLDHTILQSQNFYVP